MMISAAAQMRYALDPVAFASDRLKVTPDDWQARFLRSDRSTILRCSRQSGKTTSTAIKATHQAVYQPGSLTLVVAPSQRQSAICARKINGFIKSLQPVEVLESDNKLSFTLANKSEVWALPGDPETLRGFSAPNLVIIDEAAFASDALMEAVVPMLAVSEGHLLLLSTPNGQRGFFYEAFVSQDEDWLRISVPASQCPRIKPEFLEKMRKKLPAWKFEQEFNCVFGNSENQIFSSDMVRAAFTKTIKPLFTATELNAMGAIWI